MMTTTDRARFRPLVGLGLLALFAVGCQGQGNVAGQVTYQGKPLVFGTVQFEGSDGSLHQCNLGSDGRYAVAGVATGEAKVAVSSRNPKSSDFQPMQRDGGPKPPPQPEVKGWFPIPEKYETPGTSGLTYTVKRGENEINITLE